MNSFKTVALSRRSPYILTLVAASWVLEAAVLYGVAHLSPVQASAASLVWANSVTISGQIFHITPGGIGTYESTLSGALVILGISWQEAYTIAVLTHAFKFAVAFLLGGYSFLRMPIRLREARRWTESHSNRATRAHERKIV